jgi:hypothetical protein
LEDDENGLRVDEAGVGESVSRIRAAIVAD